MNDNNEIFRTGAQLLAEWGCKTREQKLERACMALMEQVNQLHIGRKECDLKEHLNDEDVACSCADAFRMGHEAIGPRLVNDQPAQIPDGFNAPLDDRTTAEMMADRDSAW